MNQNQAFEYDGSETPHTTGVYLLLNERGKPLYIGKAKDLKKRVTSHFNAQNRREKRLTSATKDVDWIVTENEVEALILENNLIKESKPRYNIQLKDDKSYPWLKITDEDYPALLITREKQQDGARYFGPYGDVGALRETLKFTRKLFPVRNCSRNIGEEKSRVCLDYHIKRCSGPCEGHISKAEYEELIENVIHLLRGEKEEIIHNLKQKMEQAADQMEFKRAAKLKERLNALKKTVRKQRVTLSNERTQDIFAIARKNGTTVVEVLFIRKGKLVGQTHFKVKVGEKKSKREALSTFIQQYYNRASFIPPRIVTPYKLPDEELITSWLSQETARNVTVAHTVPPEEKALISMAKKNAKIHLDRKVKAEKIQAMKRERRGKALTLLKEKLELPERPTLIEGFDVSNIQGAGSTGSKVSFKKGTANKQHYRHYNLEKDTPNDYAMIHELVSRRFDTSSEIPDLLLIDGGKGQISAAVNALTERNVQIPVIGLAKRSEKVYTPQGTIDFSDDSPALLLLKRIRDEAHRFAISYHKKLRRRTESVFDDIPGIGDKKKTRLILKFGSIEGIKEADKKELQKVKGIGEKTAENIYEVLHKS